MAGYTCYKDSRGSVAQHFPTNVNVSLPQKRLEEVYRVWVLQRKMINVLGEVKTCRHLWKKKALCIFTFLKNPTFHISLWPGNKGAPLWMPFLAFSTQAWFSMRKILSDFFSFHSFQHTQKATYVLKVIRKTKEKRTNLKCLMSNRDVLYGVI